MKLFKFNKDTYKVEVDEGAVLLTPFRVIWNRDRSASKDKALSELAYVYFMYDQQSDYLIETNENERSKQISYDLKLGDAWKPDKKVNDAATFYMEHSVTPLATMYNAAIKGGNAVNSVLNNADEYIKASTNPIKAAKDVIDTLNKVPSVMANIKAAEKELIQEKEITENRKKGSQTLNMFEDGL